jgi:hypothetical protein
MRGLRSERNGEFYCFLIFRWEGLTRNKIVAIDTLDASGS